MVKQAISSSVKKEVAAFIKNLRADKLPIEGVIVFGSYAKGKARPESDIDVCVVSPRFRDPLAAMQYLWLRRPGDVGLTIEPVGFSRQDLNEETELTREIKKFGVQMPL